MADGTDPFERRLGRDDFLKLAALAGGTTPPGRAGRGGSGRRRAARRRVGPAAGARLGGLRQRRRAGDVRGLREEAPEEQAAVHLHDQRVGRARQDARRPEAGPLPALRRLGEVLRPERPRRAVGPEADPELQEPEPVHGQGRAVQRQAVRDPGGLGLRRRPLPQRQGPPEGEVVEPALRRALQGPDRVVRRPEHARDRGAAAPHPEALAHDRRAAGEGAEVPDLEEAPGPDDLGVRDRHGQRLRLGRHLDRLRLAQRLGADEGEEAEGRLHAPEGAAGRLGRDADARQGHSAAEARARLRRRVELDRPRRSGSRTTTATATRTRRRGRARATCCARCS